MVFRKRYRKTFKRYARRYAKRTYQSRSRKLYAPKGRNPNQIIELKNIDYMHYKAPLALGNSTTCAPVTFAAGIMSPSRVINGTESTVVTPSTSVPLNCVTQGSASNQREGRKINCVKLMVKYVLNIQSSVALTAYGALVHVMVILDTAANGSLPDMSKIICGYGRTGDGAGNTSYSQMFWPNPSGVNQFRILKHKILRPRPNVAYNSTAPGPFVQCPPITGSFAIDLKGLPTTFYSGAYSTVDLADVASMADNAIYLVAFGGAITGSVDPGYNLSMYSRLLYTG